MKISEMNTVQLSKCLVEISVPAANIMEDTEVTAILAEVGEMKEKTLIQGIGSLIRRVLPLALNKHADDAFTIIAALTGKTVAQVKKQNGLLTIRETIDSFDNELVDFFKSSRTTD